MKKGLFSLLLMLCVFGSKLQAQVTIPDPNLLSWMQANGYAAALTGNVLDTLVADAMLHTYITMDLSNRNISDLTGFQYVLRRWQPSGSGIPYTGDLNLSHNNLTDFPPQLFSLNQPLSTYINLSYNHIQTLNLGAGQWYGIWSFWLKGLDLSYNGMHTVIHDPAKTIHTEKLILDHNLLDTLPEINGYYSMYELYVSHNSLRKFPRGNFAKLDAGNNQIDSITTDIIRNPGFWALLLDSNNITYLNITGSDPDWWVFHMHNNPITSIVSLPAFGTIRLHNCQLTSLQAIPAGVGDLWCSNNNLTSIGTLPDDLSYLYCENNPNLKCIGKLPNRASFYYDFTNTAISCVPYKYPNCQYSGYPSMNTLSECYISNPDGCTLYSNISGYVFNDVNGNCLPDVNEIAVEGFKVKLLSGSTVVQQVTTDNFGKYFFNGLTPSTYKVIADTLGSDFTLACPDTGYYSIVSSIIPQDGYNFGLSCKPVIDLKMNSIHTGLFRPGRLAFIEPLLTNLSNAACLDGVSGQVKIVLPSLVSLNSSVIPPSQVVGDTLIWNVTDFESINLSTAFEIMVYTDTSATWADTVCITAIVVVSNATDVDLTNNSYSICSPVRQSFDPNNKLVDPAGNVPPFFQDWLTYTINFQNTGNFPADFVYIKDTISNKLDINSIEVLGASHDHFMQVLPGRVLRFNFPDINLVDSVSNEPESHGYVVYRIKPLPNQPIGTTITNRAGIYFDYNAPVITNYALNTIAIPAATITASQNDICPGDTATLSAQLDANYTYLWKRNGVMVPGSSGASSLQVTEAGSYTLLTIYGTDTVSSPVKAIIAGALPNVSVLPAITSVCDTIEVVSISLTPGGGTLTGTGIAGGAFDADIAGIGSHAVIYTYTDINGCTNSDTATISVSIKPTATLTAPIIAVCENTQPVTLTASPAGGTFSGVVMSGNDFMPFDNPTGLNTVEYRYSDVNGCADTATISITVNPTPTATLTAPTNNVCDDAQPMTLTASPVGGTFSGAVLSGNDFMPFDNPTGLNTVEYHYTDANGCADTASLNITVNTKPTAALTAPISTVCEDASPVTLTASPAGGTFSGVVMSGNDFMPFDNPTGLNTVEYRYTDANGCADTATVSITVNTAPVATLSSPVNAVCEDAAPVTLNGSPAGGTFSGVVMSGNNFMPFDNPTGLNTVEYRYSDANGCADTASVSITVNAKPTASLTTPTNAVCDNAAPVTLTPSPAGGTFSGVVMSGNDFMPFDNPTGLNTIEYRYTDNNGCADTATASITVNATPTATLTTTTNAMCIDAQAVTLTAAPAGGTFNGAVLTGNSFDPSDNAVGVNNIRYLYTDNNGCADTATLSITVYGRPVVSLALSAGAFCTDNQPVNLTNSGNPVGGVYSGAQVSDTLLDISTPGNYNVQYTYTDNNGCTNVADTTVTVNALPTVTFNLPALPFCKDQASEDLTAYVNLAGGVFTGPGVIGDSISLAIADTFALQYQYADNNGCEATAQATFIVQECLGVEDMHGYSIAVYPNPASNQLILSADKQLTGNTIFLHSLDGKVLLKEIAHANTLTLNTAEVAAGIYFVTVQNNSEGLIFRSRVAIIK